MGAAELTDALHRVLVDLDARKELTEDDAHPLRPLTDGENARRLATVVERIREWILDGTVGGVGIRHHLPLSLALVADAFGSEDAAIDVFMASPYFASVDCMGIRPEGLSAVEGFHAWAASHVQTADLVTVQHEFVAAFSAMLARAPDPAFAVSGWPVGRYPPGWLALVDPGRALAGPLDEPDDPLVYAVALGQLKRGRVPRVAAACLAATGPSPPRWALARITAAGPSATDEARASLLAHGLL